MAARPLAPAPAPVELLADSNVVSLTALHELRARWTGAPVVLCRKATLPPEAFLIEKSAAGDTIRLSASSSEGLLYGAFRMLRSLGMDDVCLCQTVNADNQLLESPAVAQRLLYIDKVKLLKGRVSRFARLCASVGINGLVVAKPRALSPAMTDTLRAYHIAVMSRRSVSPLALAMPSPAHHPLHYEAALWRDTLSLPHETVMLHLSLAPSPQWMADTFAAASLYAFARFAWSRHENSQMAAYEWLNQTFTPNPLFVRPVREMMHESLTPLSPDDKMRQRQQWEQLKRYVPENCFQEVLQRLK